MEKLTFKQNEVLTYIKKFIAKNGYPPSVREICKGLNLNSPATVFTHIKKLESTGYIKKGNGKNRTIEVLVENEYLDSNKDVAKIALLGKITAGPPIEAIENPDEYISVPASLVPKNKKVFSLRVSGESMINKGIFDNDIVIVQRQVTANNGDIVVAMNEDNEVTLKTFYKEKNHIRLQPENDTMDPIILPNVTILGKAIGLYRTI